MAFWPLRILRIMREKHFPSLPGCSPFPQELVNVRVKTPALRKAGNRQSCRESGTGTWREGPGFCALFRHGSALQEVMVRERKSRQGQALCQELADVVATELELIRGTFRIVKFHKISQNNRQNPLHHLQISMAHAFHLRLHLFWQNIDAVMEGWSFGFPKLALLNFFFQDGGINEGYSQGYYSCGWLGQLPFLTCNQKTSQKKCCPSHNKPVIQYVVEEAIRAKNPGCYFCNKPR